MFKQIQTLKTRITEAICTSYMNINFHHLTEPDNYLWKVLPINYLLPFLQARKRLYYCKTARCLRPRHASAFSDSLMGWSYKPRIEQ